MPGCEKQPGIIVNSLLPDVAKTPIRLQTHEDSTCCNRFCRPDERSASGNSTLLRFGGFFADQTYLQVTRLMQRIHYLHQRLVIDGFIRSEEDGGVFLAFG